MAKTLHELTEFEKDILKQEIDLVDKTIARIDHIQLSLKNWSIIVWGGSLYLIAQSFDKSGALILLTAIIPFLFGLLDLVWSRQMLVVNYREEKIAGFINGESDDTTFHFLDPIAKKYAGKRDFAEQVTYSKALVHKGMIIFYLSLILISVVLGTCLLN